MAINHPLESVFGIQNGSMSFGIDDNEMVEVPAAALPAQPIQDDQEDEEIKDQIGQIFDAAMTAYTNQTELTEICEPRYAARNAEVANAMLKTALDAVALRAKVKIEKRKIGQGVPFGGTNITNSQVVVADRNSLLDMLAERRKLENA